MGAIVGGMIGFYLLSKAIEWIILKRIVSKYALMVWISPVTIFGAMFVSYTSNPDGFYAFHPAMFIDYFIAAILLPIIRIFWRKRKEAKLSKADR
jgi:hypothetical protein